MAPWKKLKATSNAGESAGADFWAIFLRSLKAGIAEIATTRSSLQFGREEEKE